MNNFLTKKPSGEVKCLLSKDMDREAFTYHCRQLKISMNEAVLSLLGIVFKEYSELKGDPNFTKMLLISILSYEGFAKKLEDIKFSNNWIPFSYTANVSKDLNANIAHIKEQFRPLAGSMKLLGEEVLMNQLMSLPFYLGKNVTNTANFKASFFFSSVPGPKKDWHIKGKKLDSLAAFIPASGNVYCNASAQTFGKVLKISFMFDKAIIDDTRLFMDLLHQTFDKFNSGRLNAASEH